MDWIRIFFSTGAKPRTLVSVQNYIVLSAAQTQNKIEIPAAKKTLQFINVKIFPLWILRPCPHK